MMKEKKIKKSIMNKLQGLFRVVFGRTTMVVLSLLGQGIIFFSVLYWFSDYMVLAYGGFLILAVAVVIIIYNKEENASYKLAWMLPVVVAPVFGSLLYIFMNLQIGTRYIEEKLAAAKKKTTPLLLADRQEPEDEQEAGLAGYMAEYAGYPIYKNTEVRYLPLGEVKFEELLRQLEQAREFIFMEYFIVARGYMWETVLELLKKKAAEGVEVRFMYDGMCSLVLLPYNYPKELHKYGIKSKMFSPIRPVLSTHQNNRDHRKIVVIDGHTAFTGGINLADEYINRQVRFGHWKDTSIMIKGEAVKSFTMMFLEMWNVNESQPEDYEKYICSGDKLKDAMEHSRRDAAGTKQRAGGLVLPYGDEPFDKELVGKRMYADILNRARRYVHIMTPYLILDDEMMETLKYSAKRGVETIIIMPHIPDKKTAYYLARTYYRELVENGVKIYEYTPGFVHAKVFVSDDERATVGSINLDYRSLYLHFECGVYLYHNGAVQDIEEDFQETLQKCQRITLEDCKGFPMWKKITGRALRLIAPLM